MIRNGAPCATPMIRLACQSGAVPLPAMGRELRLGRTESEIGNLRVTRRTLRLVTVVLLLALVAAIILALIPTSPPGP